MDDAYPEDTNSVDQEVSGSDVARIDEERQPWTTVIRRKKPAHSKTQNLSTVETSAVKTVGRGKIRIDAGAAESVLPGRMLPDVKLQESVGSRRGVQYVAANGSRMPNLGEKKVFFKTKSGIESNVVFQVIHARKSLASVSKIVRKGNKVVFSPSGSCVENVRSGKRIELEEVSGTYLMGVEYVSRDIPRQD